MNTIISDIKYCIRQFGKNPGFTTVAVLTLALGIGANTAIFSMINSVLIKSLPYQDSQQLVQIFEAFPNYDRNTVSGGAFKDWYEHNSKFDYMAVYEGTQRNLTGDGQPQRVSGLMVSSEFLSVLGIEPILGRDFATGEDAVGGNCHVMILTHKFWRTRYGSDPSIVGKSVLLDQVPYTIVGVLGPGALLQDDELYLIPDVIDGPGTFWGRAGHWRQVIGRMSSGVTVSEAEAELCGIKEQLNAEYPEFKRECTVNVVSLQEVYVGRARPTLIVLLGTVAFVLLIACANVSSLLLARGNARSREMAIRAAIGARSWRIIQQMLVESIVLALVGCLVGLFLAICGVKFFTGIITGMVPQMLYPELDINVLLFSICVACGCGILFGILPAWRASKPDLNNDLKETERGATSGAKRRSQSLMVVSEFAFTLVLLIGAGLFLRSFVRLIETDPGFNPSQTLAFDLSFPDAKYPENEDRFRFIKELNARLAALPGVESVGASSSLPFSLRGRTEQVSRMDKPPRTDYVAACDWVSGDYFSAAGIQLLRGRTITETDNQEGAPRVIIIDSTVVRDLYPDEDPVGKQVRFLGQSYEVVGIAAPIHQYFLDYAPRPQVYIPQVYLPTHTSIVIRTMFPPLTLAKAVRKTIFEIDPDQPMANIRTLENDVHESLATKRATLTLLSFFAAVAVSLACIGIYGVISYSVGQRARELCIRFALGAQHRDIIRLVLKSGIKLSIIGIIVGLVIALVLSRLLASLLYEVKTYDPLVFLGSIFLLIIVAVLSIYIPAYRAARTNPLKALRNE
jgi:putative ABC transport system permease protein